MAAKPRLGRGLGALLGSAASVSAPADAVSDESSDGDVLRELPVERIQPGQYQPRSDMRSDTLEELAESIRVQGIVQPVVVRPYGTGYELIAGERRWRAAQLAGLSVIPAVIKDVPDRAVIAMSLIENIQREDLNPLEESLALRRLIDEFEMTHQEAADAVGRSRTAVSNLLRLLDLQPAVKTLVEHREIEMGHARALLSLPADLQPVVARQVADRQLSVRETERLVRKQLEKPEAKPPAPEQDPNVLSLQSRLSDTLGAKTEIRHSSNGRGKLVIQYNSLDELDGILAHIQ